MNRRSLRELAVRSNRRGLVQLVTHLGLLGLTAALVVSSRGDPILLWPSMLVHGIVLIFLFAPLHECIHRTAFETRRLNDAVAYLAGLLVVLPPTWFRAFHLTHHRFTQDPERDPELATPKPERLSDWLLHVSGLPTWWRQLSMLVKHASGRAEDPLLRPRERRRAILEARLFLLIFGALAGLSLATSSALLLQLWIVPALLGQPFLRLYLLAEHTGCPLVSDMLSNTRTTLTTRLVRRLAWNMSFHSEHHAYPALPFHLLPEAHRRLRSKIAVLGDGYLRVNAEIVSDLGRDQAQAGSTASR
ncbi:MAG: fatty acid desaturase, partial [Geminicoccaceae bacterium]|nr:fatty acid desaturase [Geminicoccaceae bacterium]